MTLDLLRCLLRKRSRGSQYIQGDNIIEYLLSTFEGERNEILDGLKQLKDMGELRCDNWHRGEPIGRLHLSLEQVLTQQQQDWYDVLSNNSLDTDSIATLMPLADSLSGLGKGDLNRLCQGLIDLRNNVDSHTTESRYLVSSKYLLGSSKILDSLPNVSLRAFGIDPQKFSGPPGYVVTAGPTDPQCVVLVENPQAFEVAVAGGLAKEIAWIATFGYGLSRMGKEYGRQLVSYIEEERQLVELSRIGSPPNIETLLKSPAIYFWGDLDLEGLKIYWRLKSKIPNLQLSSLYKPMIERLEQGNGHPYVSLVGKENQQYWQCEDVVISKLLGLCKDQAIDQETLDIQTIRQFAGDILVYL